MIRACQSALRSRGSGPYWDLLTEVFGAPENATNADLAALLNTRGFSDELVFQTVVAVSRLSRTILERLARISLPYETEISIEGNVGVIRPETQ